MDHNFWLSRWEQNDIGFHKAEAHRDLIRYFDRIGLKYGDTIFVPLCGKSLDMLWLRQQGIKVIGSELSQAAIESFFAENNLKVDNQTSEQPYRYHNDGLTLLCCDHFTLQAKDIQGAIAAYDRAALVALPPNLRIRYAVHLAQLLPANSRLLLISYDYDQNETHGPPFSVPYSEIATLFGQNFNIETLTETDTLHRHLGLKARGVTRLTESIFLLTRHA